MIRVVLDTNVLVSAVLSPGGPCAMLVRECLEGRLHLLLCAEIEAEYREVLQRPRFGQRPERVAGLVAALVAVAEVHTVPLEPPRVRLPDPDDEVFAELAFLASADELVTGNLRDFAPLIETATVAVLAPRDLVTRLRGREA